jgi:hypothetical protein
MYGYYNLLDQILKTSGINIRVDSDGEYFKSFYMENNTFTIMLGRSFNIITNPIVKIDNFHNSICSV